MRRPIIVVFFSLFLMAVQALAAERGALFKVRGHGHTLHLYGTIHVGRADYFPLEPRIRAALGAAPTLALEIDTTGQEAAVMAALARHAMFASGSPGIAALPAERRARIESALREQGVDPAQATAMKPWMLVVVLAMKDAVALGYAPAYGVDEHLATLARANPQRITRVTELETMEYQAALLNRMPDEEQWRLLEETLENMASGRQLRETRELFGAYDRADRKLQEEIAQRMEEDDSLTGRYTRELLLDERNGPMADKIVSLLAREDKAVVAVGLLHLIGKRGIPELLRKRGIEVERIY
jgi:uncharacterized protein YbaP (TraB family)